MTAPGPNRLFSIPPGVPFLRTLATSLCEGRLVESFRFDPADPLALADVTVFVPTRRAARALRSEFVERLGGRSTILPVIRPLGEIDDDAGFFEPAVPAALDLDPPIGSVSRLMELARLVLAWKAALPAAVSAVHADNPLIAPASPADAVWLARGLADLIEVMETEECPWASLEKLDAADHAAWWQLTLEFLRIATDYWPKRLGELRRSSPAAHRNAILRAEARRMSANPPEGPVIVAGSTGSLPATADLIAAVMGLDAGAVVLPGLDHMMADEHWPLVLAAPAGDRIVARDDPATRTHPQYGLCRLLETLGLGREDAVELAAPPGALAERARLVSLALLPAQATPAWARQGETSEMDAALAEVGLIEAANEREEAQAVAVAMRLALDDGTDESQVALVTPDRGLARRVAIELRRFGIEADDSAGTPLASTPQGGLLRLAAETALLPGDPVALLALLKHPLARFGLAVGPARRAARILELVALHSGTGEVDAATLSALLDDRLAGSREDRHLPVWRRRIDEREIKLARDLATRVEQAVKPLADRRVHRFGGTGGSGSAAEPAISEWALATAEVMEAVAVDEEGRLDGLWGGEAGEKLAELLNGVIDAEADLTLRAAEWPAMLPALLAGETVKPRGGANPRVFIWGALEARLQHVDTMVLAGLNEQTWPGQTSNDAFLSRSMKTAIGLEPPERRIGQAAHDFQMALGAPRVVLSRAARSGTEPTVASRWLQRLLAVVGDGAAEAMRQRGRAFIDWAETLDQDVPVPFASRPEPRPPRDRQPSNYSFSEVGRLRRDPYAIYARRILRLEPVAEMVRDPSVAERGTLYHAILEEFGRSGLAPVDPRALAHLMEIADRRFDAERLPPHVAATWRPRFDRVAELLLGWERGRPEARARHVEARARAVVSPAGFSLTGLADRIDIMADGRAEIIDFKTGSSPSAKQARVLLDPQLALEAAVLRLGGFQGVPATEPAQLLYVRLKPEDALRVDRVDNKKPDKPESRSADELADEALKQFVGFVSMLAEGRRGFVSRLMPASARDFGGEYDHLARVAEWSSAESEGEEDGND